MAKVVYVTSELQFEVQEYLLNEDSPSCDAVYAWRPVERAATQQSAETMAMVLQSRDTLGTYRVVDTFQDETGDHGE